MHYRCLHGVAKGWPRLISAFGTGSGVVLELFQVQGLGPGIYNHKTNPNPSPNPKTDLKLALTPTLTLNTKDGCILAIFGLDFGLSNPDPDRNP